MNSQRCGTGLSQMKAQHWGELSTAPIPTSTAHHSQGNLAFSSAYTNQAKGSPHVQQLANTNKTKGISWALFVLFVFTLLVFIMIYLSVMLYDFLCLCVCACVCVFHASPMCVCPHALSYFDLLVLFVCLFVLLLFVFLLACFLKKTWWGGRE